MNQGKARIQNRMNSDQIIEFLEENGFVRVKDLPHAYYMIDHARQAEAGYDCVIFKGTDVSVVREVDKEVGLTEELLDVYNTLNLNGFWLLKGAIAFFGCVPKSQLLNRADPFASIPFNIMDCHAEFQYAHDGPEWADLLPIGTYQYDGSDVCVVRSTGQVVCLVPEVHHIEIRATWPSVNDWIGAEVRRLGHYYSQVGAKNINPELTLPDSGLIQ